MKRQLALLLVLTVTASCSREDPNDKIYDRADSTQLASKYVEVEEVIWNYYLSIESDMRMDLGVSQANIADHVQALIEEGNVKKPVILALTKNGPRWVTVDYHTYRDYMTSNAIIVRKFYGIQQNILDTLLTDSVRSDPAF